MTDEFEDTPLLIRVISEIQPYLYPTPISSDSNKLPQNYSSRVFKLIPITDDDSNSLYLFIPYHHSGKDSVSGSSSVCLPNLLEILQRLNQKYSSLFQEIQVSYLEDSDKSIKEYHPSKGMIIFEQEGIRKRIHDKKVEISCRKRLELVVENENRKEDGRTLCHYSFVFTTHP